MNATVSSARRVTSRTYYKLAGLGIGEMIRLSSFLLSGTCLFCNTVLWVGDSNRTCRSHSVPQHCWSAFYWFFICSNREFSVGFRNAGAKGCSEGVLIRNAWFLTEILWAVLLLWGLAVPYWRSRIFSINEKKVLFMWCKVRLRRAYRFCVWASLKTVTFPVYICFMDR